MTDAELINTVEAQKALMIAVATGGPRIQEVNGQYVQRRGDIAEEQQRRGLTIRIRTAALTRGAAPV